MAHPRTNLDEKAHKALVQLCGGVVENISAAVLACVVPKNETGNVGVLLKIAAIRKHYQVQA